VRRFSLFALLIVATSIFGSACVKKISVAESLPLRRNFTVEELVSRINAYAQAQTYSSQADLTVVNYFTKNQSKADEYPQATGLLRLQRPENIRMQVTFFSAEVADMVTDGEKFRVAIYRPEDKRQFIYGSNLKHFDRMDMGELKGAKDPRVEEAGGLINMRPQHITEAFLIKPVANDDHTSVFNEEIRQEETIIDVNRKKRLVARVYYVVYVLEHKDDGKVELRRKFWFDRTQDNTPLVRQQIFENGGGKESSDIRYAGWSVPSGNQLQWPLDVTIDRRLDGYKLHLKISESSLEINGEMTDQTFVLENHKNLKELNLDEPRETRADEQHKSSPPENANRRRQTNQ